MKSLPYLLVLALWLTGFVAASALEYAPHASLWFPPAGVTFAALVVLGWSVVPVLWFACLLGTLIASQMYGQTQSWTELLASGSLFAVAHILAYAVVALPLRSLAETARPTTTMKKVTLFLLGGAVATGMAALFGAGSLALTGVIETGALPQLLPAWWIGDYAGLLALGPLMGLVLALSARACALDVPPGAQRFAITGHRRHGVGRRAGLKLLLMLAFSALVLLVSTWFSPPEPLLFLLFAALVIQLWIVHTETELVSLLGIASFSLMMAAGAALAGLGEQALTLQFVLISLAASSYLGLAVPALYSDNHHLRQLLTHDTLTGALTRAFFEDSAREGIEDAISKDEPAVLIMVDLDRLKAINDRYGHAAGDRALESLVKACEKHLSAGQVLGRLSGDEFAIFMPNARASEAENLIQSISQSLTSLPPLAGNESIQASFGIAELDRHRPDYKDLLARADAAMYSDKRE